jgi:hypothetical protein
MRYMMIINSAEDQKKYVTKELMDWMGPNMAIELQSGGMIDTGGLAPTAKGARVQLKGGKLSVMDGPFAESKEVFGGFAIYECATYEDAVKKASDFMEIHRKLAPGWEGTCEVRPIDFLASRDMQHP